MQKNCNEIVQIGNDPPFGNFLKIYPFWRALASLTKYMKAARPLENVRILQCFSMQQMQKLSYVGAHPCPKMSLMLKISRVCVAE